MTVKVAPEFWLNQGPATDTESAKLHTTAAAFRRMVDGLLQQAQGVVYGLSNGGPELKVSATGTDVNIAIAAGACYVRGTQATDQGMYHIYNDASFTIPLLTNNPASVTNPRIDLVVARMQDQQYSGAVDLPTIEMVTGTPAASPVAPAAPANSLILAQILIPTSATVVLPANITDRRGPAGRGLIVLDDQSGAGPTASVNIVVPPGFRTLIHDISGRCDQATAQSIIVQFNGDVGANYDDQLFQSLNTTVSGSTPLVANTSGRFGALSPTGAVAGSVHASRATIQNADSTTLYKAYLYETGGWDTNTGAGSRKQVGQGQWRNTAAAINAILIKSGVGNLINWRSILSGIPA